FHPEIFEYRHDQARWHDVAPERDRGYCRHRRLGAEVSRVAKIRLRTWRRLVFVLVVASFAAILYRWISLERLQRFAPVEISGTPTPEPTATRPPVITGKLDTARLFNGITLHSTVETTPGADAATERIQPESYVLDLKLLARVPSPNK